MTTPATSAQAISNGAAEPPTPSGAPPPTLEDRVATLEQTMVRLAAALAQILATQMQPQMQQAILAQLTGQQPALG
jgi:hypothetical protein